jgi:hypothetical protein
MMMTKRTRWKIDLAEAKIPMERLRDQIGAAGSISTSSSSGSSASHPPRRGARAAYPSEDDWYKQSMIQDQMGYYPPIERRKYLYAAQTAGPR